MIALRVALIAYWRAISMQAWAACPRGNERSSYDEVLHTVGCKDRATNDATTRRLRHQPGAFSTRSWAPRAATQAGNVRTVNGSEYLMK